MNTNTPEDSKIKNEDYKKEFIVNEGLLYNVFWHHQKQIELDFNELGIPLTDNVEDLYIQYRVKDVLVSITDDLIRYASYHDIKRDTNRQNGDVVFSISEAVRASFVTKWILKLRPCIADRYLPQAHKYVSSREETPDSFERPAYRIEFCNEILALLGASHTLCIKSYIEEDAIAGFHEIFNARELSTLFYALRYRVVHQDTYTPLYHRICYIHRES